MLNKLISAFDCVQKYVYPTNLPAFLNVLDVIALVAIPN